MTPTSKKIIVIVTIVALFGGGYATGRYVAPDKVVVTEKTVEVEKQVVVTQTKTEVQIVKVADTQHDLHREQVIVKNKDGSETITTKTDSQSKTHTDTKENVAQATQQVQEKIVYQEREVTKTIERARPQWALALQPGFEFGSALGLGGQSYNLLPVKHAVANVSLERRLVGPLFLGAWANTHLDGGLSIRMEW